LDFTLSEEQRAVVDLAESVARDLPAEHDRESYPWEIARAFHDVGLTGIALPVEDGGQGATLLDSVLAIETVARVRPRAADMLQATNFGAVRQIAAFGTPEQKERYLAPVLRGEKLVTVGMTEPEAGSAASDLRTTARLDGDEVVVNGTKVFNSDGPYATHHVVWARFGDDVRSIGSVIVPVDAPGFEHGRPEQFLSGEYYCSLIMEDCRVPADHVLIREDGFRKMMSQFNIERLGNASRALGYGFRALELAVEYAKTRNQFGRPLAEFQGLQWKLADASLALESARLLLYRAASTAQTTPSATDTALAKLACNEAGYRSADTALQVFGGFGFSTEAELGYLLTRTRAWMIAGGSVEMLRNRIAEGLFEQRFSQRRPRVPAASGQA
jgi:alkylation response protein AidB-like acyl-CoA dehydrogenase